MTNDIFISYSWKNKDIADKIYSDLTLIGLNILKKVLVILWLK